MRLRMNQTKRTFAEDGQIKRELYIWMRTDFAKINSDESFISESRFIANKERERSS